MWEISDGEIQNLYAMKLVPPKNLGFWEPKVSKCWKVILNTLSLQFSVRRDLGLSSTDWIKKLIFNFNIKKIFKLTQKHYALHKHLRAHTYFLEMYGKMSMYF
jgi:hypothetical protein